jgi:hypothetical protein
LNLARHSRSPAGPCWLETGTIFPLDYHCCASGIPVGQADWPAIKKLLPEKVLRLERCKGMFEALLEDLHASVWLPPDGNVLPHVQRVIGALLPGHHFKFGIAIDALDRLHHAEYAYRKPETQQREGVKFEGMYVVYVHPVRAVVAFAEHACIHYFKENCLTSARCVNKKADLDDQKHFDDSDEEREDAQGPHVLYITFGVSCRRF